MMFQPGVFQSVWHGRALTEAGFQCFEIHRFESESKTKAARDGRNETM